MKIKGIYFITDRALSKSSVDETVRQAIEGGAELVQYREEKLSEAEIFREAGEIRKICSKEGVPFIVNNSVDIAIKANADGLHIGQDDTPVEKAVKQFRGAIGVTVHNLEEAIEAEKAGAHYVSVSPVFRTDTKKDAGAPAGIELIEPVKNAVSLPVVAIGGINSGNIAEVARAGADSAAVISGILKAEDIAGKTAELRRKFYDHAAGKR